MLEIRQLNKRFGGLMANRDINLQLDQQQIHALIGPNGAGKSTLVAQIAGEFKPDSGQIFFRQREITHEPVERRSRLGLGRMFQTTSLFEELSVLDNMRIPLLRVRQQPGFNPRWFWQASREDRAVRAAALTLLEKLGIDHHPSQLVGNLSHGERRQLEMAMTLATTPGCLLLDEPMAGLGSEESARMLRLISRLKARHAILLIEHDMDAVFELADTISVLVEGCIIASGSADEIRANRAVQRAYLGEA